MLARGGARIRARSLTIIAGAALAAVVGGCATANNSAVKVSGKALTIYASVPAGSLSNQAMQDVLDAERLAFSQKHGEVTAFTLSLRVVKGSTISDNARTAISDTKSIAYLGEVAPGSSADTLGITNAQDLLQVSPTDTAIELTKSTAAVPNSPGRYYESQKSYGRTFARVVPTAALEAKAQIEEMQALGVRQLYVTSDGSPYGRAAALAVKQAAPPAISVSSSQSGADAVFYGAADPTAAARTFSSFAQSSPTAKLFGPSALATDAFASGLGAAARNVYISSPGFLPADLTASGRQFVSDFTSTYGHAPATQAIFGYEAMAAVLDMVKQAGASANDRSKIVDNFFAIKNRDSVLGTYTINTEGDTSLAPFVFSRLRAGKLTPFKFVQVQG
jgi:branched-chain amino acid transport system substrate-binding protein